MLDAYLGLPFADHSEGDGFDCWGLIRHVYMCEKHVTLPTYGEGYANTGDREGIVASVLLGLAADFDKVTTPQPFDLVIFNIFGKPTHVAMVVNESLFLHCPSPVMGKGGFSCIERFADPNWSNRIEGFYRLKRANKN